VNQIPKKLIEVALPLEEINKAAAREVHQARTSEYASPMVGSPAARCLPRRPFAQLVDDLSSHPDQFPTEKPQEQECEPSFPDHREPVAMDFLSPLLDAPLGPPAKPAISQALRPYRMRVPGRR
jgi:hypothetical protein